MDCLIPNTRLKQSWPKALHTVTTWQSVLRRKHGISQRLGRDFQTWPKYEDQSNASQARRSKPTQQLVNSTSHRSDKSRTSAGIRRIRTFSPNGLIQPDDGNHGPMQDEPTSFLQQKAKSVMDRRREAASLPSMTSAEKAAFDDIWKLFAPVPTLPTAPEQKPVDQNDTDFRNLLELFENLSRKDRDGEDDALSTDSITSDMDTQSIRPAEALGGQLTTKASSETLASNRNIGSLPTLSSGYSSEELSEAEKTDAIAVAIVEDISTAFDAALQSTDAPPDVALWEICEEKIFPLIKLLVPSVTKLTSSAPAPVAKELAQTHPLIPSHMQLIPLLSKVYPAALLLVLRLYQRHHPTSPYCLTLLPHIKSIGPTSYVLGANTHFYNTLLSIRWDFYSDLDEISKLLAEMDRTGLEYDSGTAELLKRISKERDADIRHEKYDTSSELAKISIPLERGSQWWKKPLVTRSWNKFQHWQAVVARRLEERGLGEVAREGHVGPGDIAGTNVRWHTSESTNAAGDSTGLNGSHQYVVTL